MEQIPRQVSVVCLGLVASLADRQRGVRLDRLHRHVFDRRLTPSIQKYPWAAAIVCHRDVIPGVHRWTEGSNAGVGGIECHARGKSWSAMFGGDALYLSGSLT